MTFRLVVTDPWGDVVHTYEGSRAFLEQYAHEHQNPQLHPGAMLTLPSVTWHLTEETP